jgi:16S rRNA G966 N2-methylase RsmD/DNA-binding MarR family transcriptional regulator
MSDAQPYQVMPDLDSEKYERLKEDIANNGIEYPIILDGEGEIIDGHHRYEAWTDLGRDPDDLPTRVVDDTSEDNYHRAYRANLLRRDLSDGTKRDVVKQYLLEHPDRVAEDTQEAIADDLGVARVTVTRAIDSLQENGKLVQVDELTTDEKREQVRTYVEDNPNASNREVAREVDCDVTHVTVGNWRNEWNIDNPNTGLDTFTNSKTEAEKAIDIAQTATDDNSNDEVRKTAREKIGEISAGDTTPEEATKEVEKATEIAEDEKRREEQRESFEQTLMDNDAVEVHHGDFATILESYDDESIDHIVTDPPYNEEALPLWRQLATVAERVLKPGGLLIAYSGQFFLPDVFETLGDELEYLWQFVVTHEQPNYFIKHDIGIKYKPVVVFAKPPIGRPNRQMHDVISIGEMEKGEHEWQQPVIEASKLIEGLTEPNDIVCDPMCGSGTFGVAALRSDRRAVLIDIEEEAVAKTRKRIGEVVFNE